MSTVSTAFGDSAIMLRRNFKHTVRNPVTVFNAILFPVVMMLMFVYVFGGAFKVQGRYVDYAVPGLLVMAISYGLGATATAVNDDMTKGVINRFKAMDVSRGAVLTGHVVATTVRGLIADAVILGVGFAMGFRSDASLLDWLAAIGVMLLLGFGASWLTVAMGLAAKTVESAGMATVPLIMLPFLSSAFVPADTMGTGVRQFAEYQPFTPVIETLRGLLSGHHASAGDMFAALAWCVGFAVVGYVWAVSTFKKRA
ncbi:ABC transporter permease [Streptomyces spiralis]